MALRGTRVCVQLTKANASLKRCLQRELEELGAIVASRVTKSCTHVVLQRKMDDPSEQDRLDDDESARQLAMKLEKLGGNTQLVRPSWITASRDQMEEADAGEHQVVIPRVDPLVQRLRNSGNHRPSTGKKRKGLQAREPASPEQYDLGQLVSSSQQINRPDEGREYTSPPAKRNAPRRAAQMQQQQQQPDAMNFDTQACADVLSMDLGIISRGASPAPQPGQGEGGKPKAKAKQTRGRGRKKADEVADGEQGDPPAAAALAAVAQQLAPSPADKPAPARRGGRKGAAGAAAAAAQPEAAAAEGPGAEAEQAPVVPAPLAEAAAPQEQQRRQGGRQQPSAARRPAAPGRQQRPGPAPFKPPRLSAAAAKRDSAIAAAEAEFKRKVAEAEAQAAAEAAAEGAEAGDAEQQPQGLPDATASDEDVEEWPEAATQRAPSVRQLAAAPERALPISVATPAGYRPSASPAMPAPAPAHDGIAVPGVVRVPTPAEPTDTMTATTGARQSLEAPDSVAPTSRPAARAAAAGAVAATPQAQAQLPRQQEAPWSASRPWDPHKAGDDGTTAAAEAQPSVGGKPAAKPKVKPTKRGRGKAQQARGPAERPAAAAAAGAEQAAAHECNAAAGHDGGHKRAAAEAEDEADDRENQDPAHEPGPARKRRATEGAKQAGAAAKAQAKAGSKPAAAKAAAKPAAVASKPVAKRGVLSTSKTDPEMTQLAQAVVKEVPGMTWCPKGVETRITHLVLGSERNPNTRTEKLLLAVANGAHILSPEWLTASREAGRWLPEADFVAKSNFVEVAERARQAKQQGKPLRPLANPQPVDLHVHGGGGPAKAGGKGSKGDKGASKAVLGRLATALGAKLVGLRECDYCIVSGGGVRPKALKPDALAIRDDWLLSVAESLTTPKITHRHLIEDDD